MVTVLHVVGIFLSAFLLFLVQPMIARMLLPRFGGSPAVWNTCLLFFQAALLGGYLYSHLVARRLSIRKQVALHAVILLLPLAVLPVYVGDRWNAGPGTWPVPMLFGALAATVGVPFFVLSTNSTLVQHWLQRHGRDPYFLYSASNTGSLLALLSYPVLLEPNLGLRAQSNVFAAGYLAFVAVTVVLMTLAVRSPEPHADQPLAAREPAPGFARAAGWAFRAAVASSLLLAISLRITLDIGGVPLLWVVPLAIYLLTFIIAFLPGFPYPRPILEILTMLAVTVGFIAGEGDSRLVALMTLSLAVLFLGCWICHADLAADRPSSEHLTAFYLWISVGGVLGGLFGNIAAPMLFDSVAEFPLSLALVAVVLVIGDRNPTPMRDALRNRGLIAAGVLMAVILGGALLAAPRVAIDPRIPTMATLILGMAMWRKLKGLFAVASILTACFLLSTSLHPGKILEAERSFFGVLRVQENKGERVLLHGTTIHGAQMLDPFDGDPRLYYHPLGPFRAATKTAKAGDRIAVAGLGSGAIAALVGTGQTLTFYEIDPIVEPMASKWFTFLERSPAEVKHVLGDARLTLEQAPDGSIDMLFLDVFSSDSVPVHLLTLEAMEMYARKLSPGAFIAFHVSNRHLDLAPIVGATGKRIGLTALDWKFMPTPEEEAAGASPCHMVLLGREAADLARVEGPWAPLVPGEIVWTDDHNSVLDALRW